jgi:hypothetical protein
MYQNISPAPTLKFSTGHIVKREKNIQPLTKMPWNFVQGPHERDVFNF